MTTTPIEHLLPPRTLLTGLAMVESGRWHDGRLWFAHWGVGEVVAVDMDGHAQVMAPGPATMGGWSIDWAPTAAWSPRATRSPCTIPTALPGRTARGVATRPRRSARPHVRQRRRLRLPRRRRPGAGLDPPRRTRRVPPSGRRRDRLEGRLVDVRANLRANLSETVGRSIEFVDCALSRCIKIWGIV